MPNKLRQSNHECVPLPLIVKLHAKADRVSQNCLCRPNSSSNDQIDQEVAEQEVEAEKILQERLSRLPRRLVILLDLDNTLNDWDRQFRRLCAYYYPDMPELAPEHRHHYHMEKNLALLPELKDYERIPEVLPELVGFWADMPLAAGAHEAVMQMMRLNYHVYFVTKPDQRFLGRSSQEKANWLEKNFGAGFKARLITCCDKTLVRGDILIDDNPGAALGCCQPPSWIHAFYCQPYNRHMIRIPWGPGEIVEGSVKQYRVHSWHTWHSDLRECIEKLADNFSAG